MNRPARKCLYSADTHYDHRGVAYCTCGSRKGDRIHQLKEQNPDVTEYEQRKTGDR